MGDSTGSKATPQARSGLGPTGYDPDRKLVFVPPKMYARIEAIASGDERDENLSAGEAREWLKVCRPNLPIGD